MIGDIRKDNTALVIVDVQERLLKIMDPEITRRTTFAINLMVHMFQRWDVPEVVTEQYPKGLGHTATAIAENLPNLKAIEKLTFSCCGEDGFNEALRQLGRPNIILTGMETHICVLQTALDLIAAGYKVFVAIDAVQSSSKLRYRNGLALMEGAGAVLANSESLLFQMLGRCDNEDFKAFQKKLKEQYQ